jgi:hypothetical protein
MPTKLFSPKSHPIRDAFMLGRRNGSVINPPRLAEIGGMNTKNGDQREPELSIKKPGGTK